MDRAGNSDPAAEARRFEELLDRAERLRVSRISFAELRELGLLYRRGSARLARVRERSDDPDVERHLNALSVRAYTLLYGARSRRATPHGDTDRMLRALARAWPAVRVAFALLVMGIVLGASLASRDLQAVWVLLPGTFGYTPVMLEELGVSEEAREQFLERTSQPLGRNALFGSSLFSHNTRVGLLALATGMLAAVPTVMLQLYNGLVIGAFASVFVGGAQTAQFLAWVLPHGIPELTAVCLCVAGGVMLGGAVAAPGRSTRRRALREAMDSALLLFGIAIPLFFLAAILESFVRESTLGTAARLGIAAGMVALLAAGLLVLRRLSRRPGTEGSWLSELRQTDA